MHFMQYVYDILPVGGVRLTRSFTKIRFIDYMYIYNALSSAYTLSSS